MPTINQLSAVTAVTASDILPIYSSANGDARKASMTTVLAFIESNFASPEFSTVITAPTTSGFNIQLASSTSNIWAIINPTGAFAAGTITLPPVADCFDGQQIIVTCTQAITALTVAGNGAAVNGAPSSLAVNGFFALRFNTLQQDWYCVAQSLGAAGTFTNITITNAILDANGNELVKFIPEAAAVNEITIVNSATGNEPVIAATGGDANIDLGLAAKGTGVVRANGSEVVTFTGPGELAGYALDNNLATNMTLVQPIIDVTTVAALPVAAVELRGARATVTNATQTLTAGIGAVVAGVGANVVPVFCDGTNWRIG